MSVSTSDLKSMMNRVRRDPPAPPPEPAAAPSPPPVAASAAPAPLEEEGTDVNSILMEIQRDEELLLRILGLLYRAKKKNPNGGAVAIPAMEKDLGLARESATFVLNYMKAKKLLEADDKSRNMITVDGIEYLQNKLNLALRG